MLTIQLLFTHLILIHTVDSARDYVYFITPSSTTQYAGESWLTLSTLATNSSGYFSSLHTNTTVIFLEGNHTFDSELVISNISGSLILLYNGLGTAAIICNNEASMEFSHITQLKISGLEFIRCSSKVEHVDQFTLEDSNFLGQNSNSALLLNYTNANIIQSSFKANTIGTYQSLVGVLTNLRNYYDPFLDLQPHVQFYGARVGGALVVTSSTVTISTSCFESNAAAIGGAIFLQMGSIIDINNCTFINNSATGCSDDSCHGGALFIDSGCTVSAHNSTFTNNTAEHSGGAIALFQGNVLESTHNAYSFNRAGRLGGAISAFNKRSIINDCYINRNGSSCKGITYYTVLHSHGSIMVGNNFFNNNQAGLGGGVVFSYFSRSIRFINSSFNNSSAGSDGGVLYAMGNLSSIMVVGSFFSNNTAGRDGGVLHDIAYFNSSIRVVNSIFHHNEVGFNGGVLYALHVHDYCTITVIDSSFESNVADSNGGVIYAKFSSRIALETCSFDNNEAGRAGGVLHAYFSSNISLVNSSFNNSTAGSFGGTMAVYSSYSITLGNSSFDHNRAESLGGVMYAYSCTSITMDKCSFDNNQADDSGGVMFIWFSRSYIKINVLLKNNCTFFNNTATDGGVAYVRKITFTDQGSTYCGNMASNGGVIILNQGHIQVTKSKFVNNTAKSMGGVLYSAPLHHHDHHSTPVVIIKLENSYFIKNSALSGGAIAILSNVAVTLVGCNFTHNYATIGGAMYALTDNDLVANCSCFFHNSAKSDGGMIYSEKQNRLSFNNCELNFNRANNNGGSACLLFQSEINISGESSFVGNQAHSGGIIHARGSSVNIYSQSLLMVNNSAIDTGGAIDMYMTNLTFFNGSMRLFQNQARRGGALYASESRIDTYNDSLLMINNTARDTGGAVCLFKVNLSFIYSNNTFVRNEAIAGGAIYLNNGQLIFSGGNSILFENKAYDGGATYISKSMLVVEMSQIKICSNSAVHHGGGLYLTVSQLKIKGRKLHIVKNRANSNGGGIHATNSLLIIIGTVHFISNEAENGGGVSLEKSTKLYGIPAGNSIINFSNNKAKRYGGAMYIADKTNPDMCAAVNIQSTTPSKFSECFSKSLFISVSNNSAGVSGQNLFGGLLDRCTVHNDGEYQIGIMSFLNSSNIDKSQVDTITSHPLRICFCRDGQPDCNYQPDSIQVNRGKNFSVELVAYDQVHRAVNASIQCSQNSSVGGLGEGQQIQIIKKSCTELKYSLFTSNSNEGLTFSAVEGPCNNMSGISERSIVIDIICSCPIGFQISNNNEMTCDCACDKLLESYEKTECNQATKSIIRRENFWISYVNHTWPNLTGYVIYPHCPFDYCYTPDKSVSVNLNFPNGSDAQCASNRTGILCGSCIQGLCVSLGSSKCVQCPAYWPGLLVTITIVFIVSGICLVAFLLALNLTVAVGTLNAIIFYANIVAANKSAFFPSGVSPASVFISWLNFDLGFDICFFDGLNTYIKTWLQLAFPAYIIIIVVVIIKLSYYSSEFGHLVGKKDPVATLAILILLSYTKLLQNIITAFSMATLVYPDGSKRNLWLPDASVDYFTSKHLLLFLVATFILLVGLIYTLLLFSWQWLLHCPRKSVKWILNQKLSCFMETYFAPYTPKHRYWTGLLLIVRVSVYLVSAFNTSGDPRVKLSFTACIISTLVGYIAILSITIYKNRFINAMEIFTYLNITVLTIFTWYTIDADENKRIIINISVGTTFFQFIAIIAYHVYKYMNQKIFLAIQGYMICIKLKMKLTSKKLEGGIQQNRLPDDEDSNCYHELIDMIDYRANSIPTTQKAEPSHSVVELSNSY